MIAEAEGKPVAIGGKSVATGNSYRQFGRTTVAADITGRSHVGLVVYNNNT